MKRYLTLTSILLFLLGCRPSGPQKDLHPFTLGCPKIQPGDLYIAPDSSFSFRPPAGWKAEQLEKISDKERLTLNFGQPLTEISEEGKFIQYHQVLIMRYQGEESTLEHEHQNDTVMMRMDEPSLRCTTHEKTNLLGPEAYCFEYEDQDPVMGESTTLGFRLKAKEKKEYFLVMATFWGAHHPDQEICQLENVLKSFTVL